MAPARLRPPQRRRAPVSPNTVSKSVITTPSRRAAPRAPRPRARSLRRRDPWFRRLPGASSAARRRASARAARAGFGEPCGVTPRGMLPPSQVGPARLGPDARRRRVLGRAEPRPRRRFAHRLVVRPRAARLRAPGDDLRGDGHRARAAAGGPHPRARADRLRGRDRPFAGAASTRPLRGPGRPTRQLVVPVDRAGAAASGRGGRSRDRRGAGLYDGGRRGRNAALAADGRPDERPARVEPVDSAALRAARLGTRPAPYPRAPSGRRPTSAKWMRGSSSSSAAFRLSGCSAPTTRSGRDLTASRPGTPPLPSSTWEEQTGSADARRWSDPAGHGS